MQKNEITWASSTEAQQSWSVLQHLQTFFQDRLQSTGHPLLPIHWQRDHGRHGGGHRLEAGKGDFFNRASINVSQVHYEDDPQKSLSSASALSTIIHPDHPRRPSLHLHISWTQSKSGQGYWRLMADLNPSLEVQHESEAFRNHLEKLAPDWASEAFQQGDHYFWIPALGRHRGVVHFYLEQHQTGSFENDLRFAQSFGEGVIEAYSELILRTVNEDPSKEERRAQLAYHTLYLFQVLTLDRGTTAGLLVHDQNDEGILASLPARVDLELLRSWLDRLPERQQVLLKRIVDVLEESRQGGKVDLDQKRALAHSIRGFYQQHPEALNDQAKGFKEPPTVQQHIGKAP